jgi:hypothetical protein
MGFIFEINRDFPYQVPLSFDEAAMEVLDWLEECGFPWDMYVDLPAHTVSIAFARWRMLRPLGSGSNMRRKGELSPAVIDRGWPHQVALPASASLGGGYKAIHKFCKDLTLRPRGHSVAHKGQWFNVYCFVEATGCREAHEFGDEKFYPKQRGKGSNWAKWYKP